MSKKSSELMSKTTFPDHLSNKKAAELLLQFGRNEIPKKKKESFWARLSKLLKEPMLFLLVAGALLYVLLGDIKEGVMLGLSAFVVIGISYYQERRSEKALDALRELSSPRALVIRDGTEKRIPAGELVPGDLVAIHEGDRIPADGILLDEFNLNIDESLLTGESFPIRKGIKMNSEPGDISRVYSSTLVTSGTGLFRVTQTGLRTRVGEIGQSLEEEPGEDLTLSSEVKQLVRLFAWSGGVICLIIVLLYGLTHQDWIQALLNGIATQMSLLPEEFPVVLAVFLAMGAWRLSKVQVLVRKPNSIERLGAVTVLCVDKTGTLTQNQMTVVGLHNKDKFFAITSESKNKLPEEFHEIAEFGVLASHRDPFDPMEKAILRTVTENDWGKDHLHRDWEFVRDYPLSPKLLAMSCVWKAPDASAYIVATKGAPEAVIDLCHLGDSDRQSVEEAARKMAKMGLRVLGVARAKFPSNNLPASHHDFDFQWLGLIGLEDPLRVEVPQAIETCRKAGIRVIMMTGDYPETALKIAQQAGLDVQNALLTGTEVEKHSDEELKERLKTAHIFARMVPEHKLRVVKLLKDMKHVVAMTGDGVNDAPSLKWADVGIAMGSRGTDVAREASDIVLLNDDFSSIVAGIERGRMIFNNIRKALAYIVSIHVPIASLSVLPVIFNWPTILSPIHIVILELIIDPACSLMFEAYSVDEGVMKEPPRHLESRLFGMKDIYKSALQGVFLTMATLVVLWFAMNSAGEEFERARSLAFTVLVLGNLGLIFADLTDGRRRSLALVLKQSSTYYVIGGLVVLLIALMHYEPLGSLFKFGALSWGDLAVAALSGLLIFVVLVLVNRSVRRFSH